jgi:outer membrane protein OmpU
MIKRYLLGTTAVLALSAQAQSSVSIYGVIDAGITYIDNQGGFSQTKFADGVNYGNRLGFRGSEDLGGGLRALFNLEMGFNLRDGTLAQGGRSFGRQSWVGLQSDSAGTMSAGRQYDFVRDYLTQFNYGGFASVYAGHQGDYDRISGRQMDNSVKYVSPSFGGFTFGGMFAFGEQIDSFNKKSAFSLGSGYKNGPLSIGAAYVRLNDTTVFPYAQTGVYSFMGLPTAAPGTSPNAVIDLYPTTSAGFKVDKQEIAGIGFSYKFDKFLLAANTTATKFTKGPSSTTQNVYEIGGMYFLDGPWALVGGYQYVTMEADRWNQYTGGVRYSLSKRTTVYGSVSYLHASSKVDASQGAGFYMGPSSDNSQTTYRAAMVHSF